MGEISAALKRLQNERTKKCPICRSRTLWGESNRCYECYMDYISKPKTKTKTKFRGTITDDYRSFTGIHYEFGGSYSGRYVHV